MLVHVEQMGVVDMSADYQFAVEAVERTQPTALPAMIEVRL